METDERVNDARIRNGLLEKAVKAPKGSPQRKALLAAWNDAIQTSGLSRSVIKRLVIQYGGAL